MRMYGLSSDCAAALVVARRGMRLSERLPSAITAYFEVNSEKHVWHWWSQLIDTPLPKGEGILHSMTRH